MGPGAGKALNRAQGPASSQVTADHVAFRWCAYGSPRSECWACTSLAPTQVKLLKDLLWGSSKSQRVSAITRGPAGVPRVPGSTTPACLLGCRCFRVVLSVFSAEPLLRQRRFSRQEALSSPAKPCQSATLTVCPWPGHLGGPGRASSPQ